MAIALHVVEDEDRSRSDRQLGNGPLEIDGDKVAAQQTRRILDRLVGYEVSPVLWRKLRPKLSAGRVQSVATRLIVAREEARMRFVESAFCGIEATLSDHEGGPSFTARLAETGTTILVSTHYMDEAERCHRLAILDHGVKVADGTPRELQEATGMHILEVTADDPYAAQGAIIDLEEVVSVTQLGMRLRVLIPDTYQGPKEFVERALAARNVRASVSVTPATLEDVFVAATRGETGG